MDTLGEDLHRGGPAPLRDADPGRSCRRLVGQVALVTAAARGIGFASAIRLAAEGATVCITDRDQGALEEAARVAGDAGFVLSTMAFDACDPEAAVDRIGGFVRQSGRIDVLVNNAGGSLHTPFAFEEESAEDWRRVLDLNVMATVSACKAVLPAMKARRHGRIVNFGSKAGRFGSLIAGANYAAAKGAVAAMTRQLAQEYGPYGITVNCICPGVVMTERTSRLWAERRTAEERDRIRDEIPLRRHCEVEDVAASVAFFASDDAAFVTGVTLDLNGGQAMA
jgi:NAD(P)-dependent dehydrogenase (short-subunit alcohol dehydrogenase family)